MLRRRNNPNRTFAGAKPDTSHFAYFEVRNWTLRISHISQVRNRTLRISHISKCETGHFAFRIFRRCETGHFTVSQGSKPDTPQFRTRTLHRQTLSESVWRRNVRVRNCGVSGFAPCETVKCPVSHLRNMRNAKFPVSHFELCEMRSVRFRTCECTIRIVPAPEHFARTFSHAPFRAKFRARVCRCVR